MIVRETMVRREVVAAAAERTEEEEPKLGASDSIHLVVVP
jgi:hypothetical protein